LATSVAKTQLIPNGVHGHLFRSERWNRRNHLDEPSFDDSSWTIGKTPIGFASGSELSANGLYAYWPLQEGAGTVASNLVTGGADGLIYGASWANDPVRGTVLSFNGQNSYVSAGTIPRMGSSSNFTWSFWYQQRSVPNLNAVILGNRSGSPPGTLQFIKFTPSNFEYFHDGNLGIQHLISRSGWHHLAVVKNGSELNYFENGVNVGVSKAGADVEVNPFYWGGDPGALGEFVDGLIDDISLWTKALTADQIRSLSQGVSPVSLTGHDGSIATDLGPQMQGSHSSAYLRIPFSIANALNFNTLKLRIQYDDGFVAYLNGVEVARRNAPASLSWNSTATAEHPAPLATEFEEIDISAALPALVTGSNVLAIQGLNRSPTDSSFLILPVLEGSQQTELGRRYFPSPTPGAPNEPGFLGVVAEITFDHLRGFYDNPFTLALTCATPGATIRYTTDGTEPSLEHGTTYTAPLPINGTTVLRATAFNAGYYTRGIQMQTYLFLDQVLKQNGADSQPPGAMIGKWTRAW
jgi:hypothetical protein